MEARYAIGDWAGALAEYERFSARLREDLDVEPMPETTALYADMIRRTASVALEAPAPTPAEPASGALPFVGREAQLETLREAWSRARQRRGGLAFVGGESGVGKTRLVDELAAHAVANGGAVVRGGTTFIETGPYQALVEALRNATTLADVAGGSAWRPALATMLPEDLHWAGSGQPLSRKAGRSFARSSNGYPTNFRGVRSARCRPTALCSMNVTNSRARTLIGRFSRKIVSSRHTLRRLSMSSDDLLVKLDDHLKATAQLHTVLHDHLKAHPEKLASCERLTKAHAATTDLFHHDAQVLVRPTGQP